MIPDHIKDKLLGKTAMRWAIRLNLGVGLTAFGFMLLAMLPVGPAVSAEMVTKVSAGVIATSAIGMLHCALAGQWSHVKLSRSQASFESALQSFNESWQAQAEAVYHRARAQAEGRPHEH